MPTKAKLFLSYAREDRESVEAVYDRLKKAGFEPWMDVRNITGGENWERVINKAVQQTDFFLIFLSRNSVNRRGVLQKEIRAAEDSFNLRLETDIYLIPIRLDDCAIPESLSSFQWVDLFHDDGWNKLKNAVQVGFKRRRLVSARREIPLKRKRESKKRLFIAMPFSLEMEDRYFYGMQRSADATGFSCDRVDKDAFTGDILKRIREGIDKSVAVIADLTNSNPNVYLEVGYAWGIQKPTILLIQDGHDLCFDVRGQRCLKYTTIRSLEDILTSELEALKSKGII